ncbi:hypothetical protein Hanom_Chr12g01151401 [Helianthus anomalus]
MPNFTPFWCFGIFVVLLLEVKTDFTSVSINFRHICVCYWKLCHLDRTGGHKIFVIPVLIGLLFELLVIVPMRVAVDESPVFLLYQDWALGLVVFKIWTRLVRLHIFFALIINSRAAIEPNEHEQDLVRVRLSIAKEICVHEHLPNEILCSCSFVKQTNTTKQTNTNKHS